MGSLRLGRVTSTMLPIYLLLFCGLSMSQTVAPSDLSSDLPVPGTTRFLLNGSQLGVPTLRLYPLTPTLADLSNDDFQTFNITGPLVNISPTNINTITSKDIVFISCDDSAYAGSNLKASNTFQLATQNNPAPLAVILYSVNDYHCNYTSGGASVFDPTFTTVDSMIARTVASRNNSAVASIYPDLAALSSSSGSSNTSTNGSSSATTTSTGAAAPTTALAMIILYAITGLITALFLVIIITGAIRAHRHPERYGPRSIVGRPRQSRAKGIARAMLETIPIVKFGDPDVQPAKPTDDVELAAASTEAIEEQTNREASPTPKDDAHAETTHSEEEPRTADDSAVGSDAPRPDGSDEHGTLGCSICTEDFAKGQEVRVLPCNHKFHPACVDPWLLNVSGTCPLCRINLNPDAPEENVEATDSGTSAPTFHLAPPISTDSSSRRPLSSLFSQRSQARRMSHMTPAERLATARRLHTESGAQGQAPRLSERVRERLRIRTRRQGEESSTSVAPTEEGITTATVPANNSASTTNATPPSGPTEQ